MQRQWRTEVLLCFDTEFLHAYWIDRKVPSNFSDKNKKQKSKETFRSTQYIASVEVYIRMFANDE